MAPNQRAQPRPRALALGLITALLAAGSPALAQSNLLESVKRNPAQARKLCNQLRAFNQQGLSYTSKKALQQIASQQNLSVMDAEVLTTYVVGLHCPDVR
jgi:ABC-type transporter MlaC component